MRIQKLSVDNDFDAGRSVVWFDVNGVIYGLRDSGHEQKLVSSKGIQLKLKDDRLLIFDKLRIYVNNMRANEF